MAECEDGPSPILRLDGEVAMDGAAIAVRIVSSEEHPVRICLRAEDVQYMVSMLLHLSCEARRRQPSANDAPPRAAIPLPVSAVDVGQDDQDRPFLMLEIGTAALLFGVPADCLKQVGQTLLALSVSPSAKPS